LSTDLPASDHTNAARKGYWTPLPDPEPLASQPSIAQFGARHTGVEPANLIEIENPYLEIQPDSAAGEIQFRSSTGKVSQCHSSVADHSPASRAEEKTVVGYKIQNLLPVTKVYDHFLP